MSSYWELRLNNFRTHATKTLTLNPGLNLLTGDSGCGKTTIFAAMLFCLFQGKMQNIKPLEAVNPSVSVRLTRFEESQDLNETHYSTGSRGTDRLDFSIFRSRPPETLVVTLNDGTVYCGEEAQSWIHHYFGTELVWLASSYLRQGESHLLVSGSGADKSSLLRDLAFNFNRDVDQPHYYLNRLRSKQLESKNTADQISVEATKARAIAQHFEATYSMEPLLDPGAVKQELESLSRRLIQLQDLSITLNTVDDLNRQIKELEDTAGRIIPDAESMKRLITTVLEWRKLKSKLTLEWTAYPLPDLSWCHSLYQYYKSQGWSHQDLPAWIADRQARAHAWTNSQIILQLNEARTRSHQIQTQAYQDNKASWEAFHYQAATRTSLMQALEALGPVEELRATAGLRYTSLTCPHCQEPVFFDTKKLVKISPLNQDRAQEILDQHHQLSTQLSTLCQPPPPETLEPPPPLELETIEATPCTPLTMTQVPTSSYQEVKKWLDHRHENDIYYACLRLQEAHPDIIQNGHLILDVSHLGCLETKLQDIAVSQALSASIKGSRATLESQLARLPSQDDIIHQLTAFEPLKERYSILEGQLQRDLKYREYQPLLKVQQDWDMQYTKWSRYLEDLNRSLKLVEDCTNTYLENLIESLNYYLAETIGVFFDQSTIIKISGVRTLKSGDQRLQVNLEMSLNGKTYSLISNLSGGERDRISLALNIAFARVSRSKFLLIDEGLSSLQGDLKTRICEYLDAIAHETGLVIVNICHDIPEGYHSRVVTV